MRDAAFPALLAFLALLAVPPTRPSPPFFPSSDTNGAAYSDGVSVYAALGWDALREPARAVTAVTPGRG
ncbi:hypothetical protein ACH41H_21065 [Streptomyces sp. NPDC020800]|uniref:hypothetical protein n=1 Tax=Streptomyces sp. NPDC020800 TaxID=3365092 RepID=UPI0037AABC7E